MIRRVDILIAKFPVCCQKAFGKTIAMLTHFAWLLLLGCATPDRLANLITADPESNKLDIFFDKKIILFKGSSNLPVNERYLKYEEKLNSFLSRDRNTASCSVVPGTINFGEPGSGGVAIVKVSQSVPAQVDTTSFTLDGKPFYRYWMLGDYN